MEKALQIYVRKFSSLRRGVTRYGPAPHKPILLLAVLQGVEAGWITENRIELSPELVGAFKSLWRALVSTGHSPLVAQPFFFMRGEKFWHHVPNPGYENWVEVTRNCQSLGALHQAVAYVQLDSDLFTLIMSSAHRAILKQTLLKTYFPKAKGVYPESDSYPGLHLPLVAEGEVNAVPIFDLAVAAGHFSEYQRIGDYDWVQLPEFIRFSKDLFVAQVVGESMNKRIPNGSWCLFREGVSGSRQGKIVLVQHHEIYDEDLGGQYTVKRYESEKTASEDRGWVHSKVTLKPETTAAGYEDIVISENDEESLRVIAEFVAVL